MKGQNPNSNQRQFLCEGLSEMLNPDHPLYRLAEKIDWQKFEAAFSSCYSEDRGRPAKPIRLMTSLIILKHLYDLGDETVIDRWLMDPYFQYFSGKQVFQWKKPTDPSELVHFRDRIGPEGVEKILEESIDIHGREKEEKEVLIDTTVQEKDITFPTDSKLHKKIIDKCNKIADKEELDLRQSYRRVSKRLLRAQHKRRHPSKEKRKAARKAARKLKTRAGRILRDVERKLPEDREDRYAEELAKYQQVLNQKRTDKDKIYSLHEPQVKCISKGKAHKKYEFGSKASIVKGMRSGLILGALDVSNQYDGHTLEETLAQQERLTGQRPHAAIVDRGYRGVDRVGKTEIIQPDSKKGKSEYEIRKARRRHRKRAGIEATNSHLKHQFRLSRNYLKGKVGDKVNLMLAAAAFNFKKWINKTDNIFVRLLKWILQLFYGRNLHLSTLT